MTLNQIHRLILYSLILFFATITTLHADEFSYKPSNPEIQFEDLDDRVLIYWTNLRTMSSKEDVFTHTHTDGSEFTFSLERVPNELEDPRDILTVLSWPEGWVILGGDNTFKLNEQDTATITIIKYTGG